MGEFTSLAAGFEVVAAIADVVCMGLGQTINT